MNLMLLFNITFILTQIFKILIIETYIKNHFGN